MAVDDDLARVRRLLSILAGNKKKRRSGLATGLPCDWRPWTVPSPDNDLGIPFTEPGAWRFIQERLIKGHPIKPIRLDVPAGEIGYEMLIDLKPGKPQLYVKLQLHGGFIYGRSFHESEYTTTLNT